MHLTLSTVLIITVLAVLEIGWLPSCILIFCIYFLIIVVFLKAFRLGKNRSRTTIYECFPQGVARVKLAECWCFHTTHPDILKNALPLIPPPPSPSPSPSPSFYLTWLQDTFSTARGFHWVRGTTMSAGNPQKAAQQYPWQSSDPAKQ